MKAKSKRIKFSSKYAPMFDAGLDQRYVILSGGRGSGKSFVLSCYLVSVLLKPGHVIWFARYTMVSADKSIVPEFMEKIEMLGLTDQFRQSGDTIVCTSSGSRIFFKGIKTSSGNQTASAKSIAGLTMFVLDESEELTDKATFDKIVGSIRVKGIQNRIIMSFNPPKKSHWIYKHFYEKRGYHDCVNTITDNTIYIHTTYLDNYSNLDEAFIKEIKALKDSDYEDYEHQFLGKWGSNAAGAVYKHWKMARYEDIKHLPSWYGIDFGFSNSKNSIVRIYWDEASKSAYFREVDYCTGRTPEMMKEILLQDHLNHYVVIGDVEMENGYIQGYHINDLISDYSLMGNIQTSYDLHTLHTAFCEFVMGIRVPVICDAARPEVIAFLYGCNINAMECIKGVGSVAKQIGMMQQINCYYVEGSTNIVYELDNYVYKANQSLNMLSDEPVKAYDDLMDSCRYAYCTPALQGQINLQDNS